jgi:hypothetical protein
MLYERRIIMANKPEVIIANAKEMINDGYVYVYGYKGTVVTRDKVLNLASLYPSVFTYTIKSLALSKVGKYGIDCSGFVCRSAGISHVGSSQIYSSATQKWSVSDLSHVQNGQFIWRSGHIGLIEVDKNGKRWILEAQSTKTDLKRTEFESRYKSFTHYGNIKGVTYETTKATSATTTKTTNPYTKPTKLVKKGDISTSVKWIQWELRECGYKISIDGDFGINTEKTVKEFQKTKKLTVDGQVGDKTIAALVVNK